MSGGLRRVALVAVLAGLVGACTTAPPPTVPEPDLSDMEPQVARLLEEHREGVVEETSSAEAWGRLGSAYDAHGLFEPAEACYRAATDLAPDDFRWSYLLAVIREARGAGADEVTTLFDRAGALDRGYAPVHVRKGDALSTRGDYQGAADAFRDAIAIAPDTAAAHRGLGQVLLALGEVDGAIDSLEEAVSLLRVDRSAHAALAQAYLRAGRDEDADRTVQRSAMLQPVHSMPDPVYTELVLERSMSSSRVYSRAMGSLRRAEYAPALADLEIVRGVRPDDASLHYWMGVAHRGLGQRAGALEAFSRAVELDGNLVRARLELARLLAEGGDPDTAAEHVQRALELTPHDPTAQATMGRIRLMQGQAGLAAEHLVEAVRRQPANADLRHDLGRAYAEIGRTDEAIRELELAVRIEPGHAAASTLERLRGAGR